MRRLLKKLIKAAAASEGQSPEGIDADDSDAAQPLNLPAPVESSSPPPTSPALSGETSVRPANSPPNFTRKVARIQSRASDNSENVSRKRKASRPGSVREGN